MALTPADGEYLIRSSLVNDEDVVMTSELDGGTDDDKDVELVVLSAAAAEVDVVVESGEDAMTNGFFMT